MSLVIPRRYQRAKIAELSGGFDALVTSFLLDWRTPLIEGIAPSFFGTSGQGKTYAAAALANFFRHEGIEVSWCSVPEDLDKFKNYKYFRRFEDWYALDRKIREAPVLIFDDITQVAVHKPLKELFEILVSKRYNEKLPVIFTGNLATPTQDNFIEEISSCFSMAMCRRIEAMSRGFLHIV